MPGKLELAWRLRQALGHASFQERHSSLSPSMGCCKYVACVCAMEQQSLLRI